MQLHGHALSSVGDLAFVDAFVGQLNVVDLEIPVGAVGRDRVVRDGVASVGEKDLLADGQREKGRGEPIVFQPGDMMSAEMGHVTFQRCRVGLIERLIVGSSENARKIMGMNSCCRQAGHD